MSEPYENLHNFDPSIGERARSILVKDYGWSENEASILTDRYIHSHNSISKELGIKSEEEAELVAKHIAGVIDTEKKAESGEEQSVEITKEVQDAINTILDIIDSLKSKDKFSKVVVTDDDILSILMSEFEIEGISALKALNAWKASEVPSQEDKEEVDVKPDDFAKKDNTLGEGVMKNRIDESYTEILGVNRPRSRYDGLRTIKQLQEAGFEDREVGEVYPIDYSDPEESKYRDDLAQDIQASNITPEELDETEDNGRRPAGWY